MFKVHSSAFLMVVQLLLSLAILNFVQMEIENARQQENRMKALAFHGHKCLGNYFAKWRTYAKLMIAKRQLRDLRAQKEKSNAKVQTFLKNIDSFENERHTESRLQNGRKLNPLAGTVATKSLTCNAGSFYSFKIFVYQQKY